MIEINKSQEAKAPVDSVWKVISDLDSEHNAWSLLRDVKILKKTDNSVEREVKIRRGPMGEATSVQILELYPAKKITTLKLTGGPMLGTRKISLVKSENGSTTKIDVNWEFDLKGMPGFAKGFVKDNVSDVTEKALAQIAKEAEAQ